MNSVNLAGFIGSDPEVKNVNDTKLCKFRLATNDGKDLTSWHDIECWDKVATFPAEYCKKGDAVAITGAIRYSTWEDENGNKRRSVCIRAFRVDKLTKRGDSDEAPAPKKPF